jgi:glycosyltransferase involved in cell wall biosynthesis
MVTPRVSVLMASYNMESFLSEAIESVLSQTFSDFELVVGDNASTDATPEILEDFARQDLRLRWFRNEVNVRAVENFNLCYRRADPDSEFWAMLGSDDWWRTDLLEKLVSAGDENPSVSLVHADGILVDDRGNYIKRYSELWNHVETPAPGIHRSVEQIFQGNFIMAFAALVRRSIAERLIPRQDVFDNRFTFGPEYELWLQLFARGASAYYIHEPLVYYRKHDAAHTIPRNTIRILRDEATMLRENLSDICLNGLDEIRRDALQSRLAWIAFDHLEKNEAEDAKVLLDEAVNLDASPRLDLRVAHRVTRLPLPARVKGYLWRQAFSAARLAGRTA